MHNLNTIHLSTPLLFGTIAPFDIKISGYTAASGNISCHTSREVGGSPDSHQSPIVHAGPKTQLERQYRSKAMERIGFLSPTTFLTVGCFINCLTSASLSLISCFWSDLPIRHITSVLLQEAVCRLNLVFIWREDPSVVWSRKVQSLDDRRSQPTVR